MNLRQIPEIKKRIGKGIEIHEKRAGLGGAGPRRVLAGSERGPQSGETVRTVFSLRLYLDLCRKLLSLGRAVKFINFLVSAGFGRADALYRAGGVRRGDLRVILAASRIETRRHDRGLFVSHPLDGNFINNYRMAVMGRTARTGFDFFICRPVYFRAGLDRQLYGFEIILYLVDAK